MKRLKKNTVPVAPFSLRVRGPTSQAALTKEIGYFRFAHGTGADKSATLDPDPCPTCQGKVEWALTYKREINGVTPYVYARCRNAPKSHRWDFTHWEPQARPVAARPVAARPVAARPVAARPVAPKMAASRMPVPRPSVGTGQRLVGDWLQARIEVLEAELTRLTEIRRLASGLGPVLPEPKPSHPN